MRMDYIDGVEPPPLRLKVERDAIRRQDARRAKGLHRYQPLAGGGSRSSVPVEETEAWRIYQEQLAAGLGEDDVPPPRITFRYRVRELRDALGMTAQELADAAGCSVRTIRRAEAGGEIRPPTQRKILTGLGLPWERRKEVFPD